MNRSAEPRKETGFTLLEVMIAVAILAIALVAVLQSQTSGIDMAYDSQVITTAALLAQQKIADIQTAIASGEKSIDGSDNFDDYPSFSWEIESETSDVKNLLKVTLTIKYTEGLITRSFRSVQYFFVPEETY